MELTSNYQGVGIGISESVTIYNVITNGIYNILYKIIYFTFIIVLFSCATYIVRHIVRILQIIDYTEYEIKQLQFSIHKISSDVVDKNQNHLNKIEAKLIETLSQLTQINAKNEIFEQKYEHELKNIKKIVRTFESALDMFINEQNAQNEHIHEFMEQTNRLNNKKIDDLRFELCEELYTHIEKLKENADANEKRVNSSLLDALTNMNKMTTIVKEEAQTMLEQLDKKRDDVSSPLDTQIKEHCHANSIDFISNVE